MKVNAPPVNQRGCQIQCYGCQQWGHKKADCPNKDNNKKRARPSLPPQGEAFNNCNKKPPQEKAQDKPPNIKINYISLKTKGEK